MTPDIYCIYHADSTFVDFNDSFISLGIPLLDTGHHQSTMSSLRNQILSAAIPLVRNHSFTRPTLRQALANLPGQTSTEGGLDATLDTLFGPSPGSERELVKAWEKQGLENMQVTTGDQTSSDGQVHELQRSLQQRLQYSSESAGEHLVEVSMTQKCKTV